MDVGEKKQLRMKTSDIADEKNNPLWTISPQETFVELNFVTNSTIRIQFSELNAMSTQIKHSCETDIEAKFNTFYEPVLELREILIKLRDQGYPPLYARKITLDRVKSMKKTLRMINAKNKKPEQDKRNYIQNSLIWKIGRDIEMKGKIKSLDNFDVCFSQNQRSNTFNSFLKTGFQYVTDHVSIKEQQIKKEIKYIKVNHPYEVFSGYQNLPQSRNYCRIFCRSGDRFKDKMQLVNKLIGRQPVIFVHPETLAPDEIQSIKKLTSNWSSETQQAICIVSSIAQENLFKEGGLREIKFEQKDIDFDQIKQKILTNDIKDCVRMYIEDPEKSYQLKILEYLRSNKKILMTFSPELFKGNACPEFFDDLYLISMRKLTGNSGYNETGEFIDINNVFEKIIFEFPPNISNTKYLSFIFDLNNLRNNWDSDLRTDNAFKIYEPHYENEITNDITKLAELRNELKELAKKLDPKSNVDMLDNEDIFNRVTALIKEDQSQKNRISALYAWNIIPDKFDNKDRMFIRVPDRFKENKKYFKLGTFDNELNLNGSDVYGCDTNDFQTFLSRKYDIKVGLNDSIAKRLLKALLRVYNHQEVILVGNTGTGKTKISNVISKILSKITGSLTKTINCNGGTELLEIQRIVEAIEEDVQKNKSNKYLIFVDEANTCTAGCYIAHKMREIFMKKEKNISFIVAANPLINSNEISKKLSLIGNKQFISMPTKSINFMDLQTSEEKELFRINHFNYTYKVRDIPKMIEFAIIEYEINLNDDDEKQCMMTIIETELMKNYGDDDTTTKQMRKKNDGFSANLESKQKLVIQDCIWELYKVIYNIIREKAAISYRNAIHFSHIFKLVYKQTGNFELALSVGIYMRFVLPYTTNAEFIDDKDDKSSNFTINNLKKYWEFSNLFDEKDKDKDVEERNFRADFVQFLNPGFAKIDNKAEYLQNGENKMLNVDVQGYITHEANKILNKAFKDFDIQKKMYEYSFAQCYKYIPEPKILKLNSIMFNLAALDIGYNIFHYMHELLPILLIAKPGTAKSLAVEYFKIYHYKPVTNETSNEPGESNDFYCSTFLTSIISQTSCLESHFYDCMRHHHRDNQVRLYTAMVFLDELGFGNLNPSLYIKELHYIFDKGIHYKIKTDQQNTGLSDDISDISEKFEKIFPVGASNYQIDHAIMNRSVVISGSRPTTDDLIRAFSIMKKQKYAIKNPDSDEAKFFDSLTKEQKYGHIDYDPKTLEKITKDDVDESTQDFFNSIKKYINNSQSLMRPVYTIIMQQSDPIEIHYPIVVSSFISLGETFKDAVEKTKKIWEKKFPHNDYNLPKYNNVLCIIKSLLFDHRLARSILFITKHYESVPVVNEFLDVLSYFKRFIIINLYENNFKQPRNIYANKSSLQICEQFMKERSNEHSFIFLIQGNNPSSDSNLDIVNQQKPYSNPDDPSDDYNPYTHIDGFSVHLNPKQMPRMHFLMVCNKKDLVNNVPLSMQDRLNAITLSFNDYIKNFEEFVDAQDTLIQNDKNELMNKFEKFKFDAMRIRKISPGDNKPCNHDLSDIEKYNKCDLNQINLCSMSFTKQEIAISSEVNFYLEKIISPDKQIKIVSPITLEDLNNTGNAIDGIIDVLEFKKSNIGILRKQWLAKKESSAKILIEHLKSFKTPLIFNGFSSQYEILFYLGATDDQFFHIGLELSQNDEELKEIIDEFKAIHDEEKYRKCISDDEILRARIIRYGMEHFTEAYVKEYEEKIKNDKDRKKCVEEIKEIKDPAVEDMHLNLSDYIQNKKMCICVTNDYVNDFKFETESNIDFVLHEMGANETESNIDFVLHEMGANETESKIDFVLHEMVANETMLFNYIQNKNTIISISHQDHNELYHYTSLIEDFFNKTKCTNHVAIVLQVKGTKIPYYVISTSKWPVYWIDTPSKNFGANQIVAIHKQIKSQNYDSLKEIVLSHLENKHKKIQKKQKEILHKFVQKYIQENADKCFEKFKNQSNKDQSNKDQSNIQNLNRVFINCFCNTLEEFYDKFYFMLKRYEDNTGNADKFKNEIDFIKIVDNKMKFSELDYPTKRFILSLDEQGIKGNIVQSFNSANNFSSLSYVFCYIFNHNDNNRFEDEITQMKSFLSPKMLKEDKFTPKPKDSEGLTGNEIKANTIDRKIYGENPDLKDCFEQDETKDLAVSKIDDTNKVEINSEYYTLKEKIQGKNPRNLIFDLFDHEIQAGDRAYTDPQLFEFIKCYKGNFFKDMLNDFKNEQSLENSKFVNSFFLENEIHFEGQEEKEESANKILALFINENSEEALIFHIVTASDNNYQSTKYCLMTIESFVTYYLFMNASSEQKMKFLEILEQFVKPSKEKESKAERTKHIKPVYDFLEKWKAMFRCHLEALYILCSSYSYDKLLGIKSKLGRDNLFVEFITYLEKSGKTEDSGELVDFREYINNENPSLKDRSFKDQINSYLEELTKTYNLIRLIYNYNLEIQKQESKDYIDLSQAKLNGLLFAIVKNEFDNFHKFQDGTKSYTLSVEFNPVQVSTEIVKKILEQTSTFSFKFLDSDFITSISDSISTNLNLSSSLGFDDQDEAFSKEMLRKIIFEKDDKTSEENLTPDDNEQTLSPDDKLKAIILLLMLVSSTETEERTVKEKFATAKAICYDRDEEELTENVLWKANSSGHSDYFTEVKCMLMDEQSKFNKTAYFKELKKIISTKYNVDI